MTKVKCQTPRDFCSGGLEPTNAGLPNKSAKLHSTHEDALKCYGRHLVRQLGYRKISAREFASPDDGPTLILSKPCRYGAKMRRGKEGNRYMPKSGRRKTRCGIVIG